MNKTNISDLRLIILIGLAQFIDILEFMVVMPLGPDYAKFFNISLSQLGYTSAVYTISAALTGFLSARYIDRYERKKVLLFAISGLVFANLIAGLSNNYECFLMARFLSGMFGGPSTAIAFAIITDLVKEEKRGYVIGKVMSAFSFAATLGVPLCLQISLKLGWHFSFFAVAFMGVIALLLNLKYLPKIDAHLKYPELVNKITYKGLLRRNANIVTILFACMGMFAVFMIIPYISAFLQSNLNFPRSNIGPLYFFGGICSFITVQIIGKYVDKYGSSKIAELANFFFGFSIIFGFIYAVPELPIPLIYAPFMIAMSMRIIASSVLISKVPRAFERAGFMSFVSMAQHITSAIGSYAASIILFQTAQGSPIQNMGLVAVIALCILLTLPTLMKFVEKRLDS